MRQLVDSIETEPGWQQVFLAGCPLAAQYPFIEGEPVSNFAKAALVRVVTPSKLIATARDLVRIELGEDYLQPPLFDVEQSYEDSSPAAPLIFILPGADPIQALTSFARRKKRTEALKTISLGQGQGVKAEKLIEEAKKSGGWVLLENCHLYPSWMPRLEEICELLALHTTSGDSGSIHPSFRLWLSSYPSPHLPSLVLRDGIKMTNEPPRDLKSHLLRSYIATRPVQD
jgi:dynein heavy chain, axonemal